MYLDHVSCWSLPARPRSAPFVLVLMLSAAFFLGGCDAVCNLGGVTSNLPGCGNGNGSSPGPQLGCIRIGAWNAGSQQGTKYGATFSARDENGDVDSVRINAGLECKVQGGNWKPCTATTGWVTSDTGPGRTGSFVEFGPKGAKGRLAVGVITGTKVSVGGGITVQVRDAAGNVAGKNVHPVTKT